MNLSTEPLNIDLSQQEPIPADGVAAALKLMHSGKLHRYGETDGSTSAASRLEAAFAAELGVRYCVALNSCGMPWAWISEDTGFSVQNLPTRYGPLDFLIRAYGVSTIRVEIGKSISLPPGGLTLAPPLPQGARIVSVAAHQGGNAPLDDEGTSVVITSLPWVADLHLGVVSTQTGPAVSRGINSALQL